jgi:hypothetical protein
MIHKKGLQFYVLGPTDAFGVRISVTGTAFDVVAGIDTDTIDVKDGATFTVTPKMLSGSGSLHELRVTVFFVAGADAKAKYTIEILNSAGAAVDTVVDALPAGQSPPFDIFNRFLLHVE